MVSKVKDALITTGTVLLVIWIARKLPVSQTVVDTALRG